jgi:hypothetical protein
VGTPPKLYSFQLPFSFQVEMSNKVLLCSTINHLFRSPNYTSREMRSTPNIGSCQSLINFPFPGIHERFSLKKGISALMSFHICDPGWGSGLLSMHLFLPPNLYFFYYSHFPPILFLVTILERSLAPIAIFSTSGYMIPSHPLFLGVDTCYT